MEYFPQAVKDFELFVATYQDKWVRHAFFKLGNKAEAEDLVQDILIKLFLEKEKYKKVTNPFLYVFKSVTNACIDKLRSHKRYQFTSVKNLKTMETGKNTDFDILMNEEYNRINQLLLQIPAEQSEILTMRIIDELSFVEISEILNIPVTTVKSRFKYGIDKLKIQTNFLSEVQL